MSMKDDIKELVTKAMNDGQRLAFDTSANLCRQLAVEFRAKRALSQADTADVCAILIEKMKEQSVSSISTRRP